MKTKDLKQVIILQAPPSAVYEALTDPKKHSAFTGDTAKDTDKLGRYTTYGGYASGVNLELKKDKKIFQTWTCTDWPEGHYSEIVYDLKKEGEGTKLTFTQRGIPFEQYKSIAKGWEDFYWEPLKEFLKA